MKTKISALSASKPSETNVKRLISSIIFAFIGAFLIYHTINSAGIASEISFLKQWFALTAIIFLLKKILS